MMAVVSEQLLERLHQANERFHRARLGWEGREDLDSSVRPSVGAELRQAELELEQINEEIREALRRDPSSAPASAISSPSPPHQFHFSSHWTAPG